MTSGFHVTQLTGDDWRIFKDVRLKALASDPGVFGSNHARESAFGEAEWRTRLDDRRGAVFALRDGDEIAGVTGVVIDGHDETSRLAIFWGTWLDPAYRGLKLSSLLNNARLAWAQRHPTCERVVVAHRASNIAAQKASLKNGFKFTHAEERLWPDGTVEDDFFYALILQK